MDRDLSLLVPAVRAPARGSLPRAMPESCIAAPESSIDQCDPVGRRDAAMVCLLATYGVRGAQIRSLATEPGWSRDSALTLETLRRYVDTTEASNPGICTSAPSEIP